MPTTHRLAKAGKLSVRSLAGEQLLHLEPRQGGAGYDRWVRGLCEQEGGFTPKFRRPTVNNLEALLGLVAAGGGVAILAEVTTRELRTGLGWVAKALDALQPPFQAVAVWNPDKPSEVLNRYFSVLDQQLCRGGGEMRLSPRRHRSDQRV